MFKFLQRLRQKKNDADFKAGYEYAATCLINGQRPVQLHYEFENHFELGIEAALQDFNIIKRKIVNTAMDELRKGLQQSKYHKPW